MALNWTMLNAAGSPVPLPNEMNVFAVDSGVLEIHAPGLAKYKEIGRIWLTDKRLIFATSVQAAVKPSFENLSVPLHQILSTKFEQPLFGANYLAFDLKPSPEGGLSEGTRVELRLSDRGMVEFVSILGKTREKAIYMKRQQADAQAEEGLPVYQSTFVGSSSAPPAETPPGYDA